MGGAATQPTRRPGAISFEKVPSWRTISRLSSALSDGTGSPSKITRRYGLSSTTKMPGARRARAACRRRSTRHRHARRVVKIRHVVDELRPRLPFSRRCSSIDASASTSRPSSSCGTSTNAGAVAAKDRDRAEVRGRRHDHRVAVVEQQPAHQLERVLGAVGDEHVVGACRRARRTSCTRRSIRAARAGRRAGAYWSVSCR